MRRDTLTNGPKQVRLVDLQSDQGEYQEIEAEFRKTVPSRPVVSIKRIQNPSLYVHYQTEKKRMATHNPMGHENERKLFHGTSIDAVDKINHNNFDRNFCGKNGESVCNSLC